jgi:hypothetical protein
MTQEKDTLKVPKTRFVVELRLRGRQLRRVEVFVADRGHRSRRWSDVLGLLDQPERFFPAQDTQTSEWLLCNKEEVIWVALATEPESDEFELFDRRFVVTVDLDDGSALDGELFFSAPSAEQRVVDYLNREERFFLLYQTDRVVLVNKASAAAVVERVADGQRGVLRGED